MLLECKNEEHCWCSLFAPLTSFSQPCCFYHLQWKVAKDESERCYGINHLKMSAFCISWHWYVVCMFSVAVIFSTVLNFCNLVGYQSFNLVNWMCAIRDTDQISVFFPFVKPQVVLYWSFVNLTFHTKNCCDWALILDQNQPALIYWHHPSIIQQQQMLAGCWRKTMANKSKINGPKYFLRPLLTRWKKRKSITLTCITLLFERNRIRNPMAQDGTENHLTRTQITRPHKKK